MRLLKVTGASGECQLLIGESLKNSAQYCGNRRVIIITDKTVRTLHGHLFPTKEIIEIESSEPLKTIQTVEQIYEQLLDREVDRASFILGIGGGIVCDITGFVASTYLRGIPFGFVPTTLLAQVDASIGGKNGVNFKGYKNMIGTFKQPEFCVFDFEVLKTLPKEELLSGFAEIIKHALIGDTNLFDYLEQHGQDALLFKKTAIEKMVHDSLVVKARIVERDETEKNERMKLNFGHTFGHGLEKVLAISHGYAVAIGMVVALRLSVSKGLLKNEEAMRAIKLIEKSGLPATITADPVLIIDAIRKDKKRRGEMINMVLLEGIGKAVIVPLSLKEIEVILHDLSAGQKDFPEGKIFVFPQAEKTKNADKFLNEVSFK